MRRGGKPLQDGEREGRGLAGAGLGDAEEIPAGEDVRNGLGLDGRRRRIFLVRERPEERRGEAELGELSQCFSFEPGDREARASLEGRRTDLRKTPRVAWAVDGLRRPAGRNPLGPGSRGLDAFA